MWKYNLALAATAALMACGCTQGTPGGPGVQNQPTTTTTQKTVHTTPSNTQTAPAEKRTVTETHTTSKPVINDSRDTFSLRVPVLSTSMKQGETKSVTIAISRGSDFKQDVHLQLASIPEGVTITPASPMIKNSDSEVKLDISAADNAALGDFTVKVTGHPDSGPDAVNEFKVNVAEK